MKLAYAKAFVARHRTAVILLVILALAATGLLQKGTALVSTPLTRTNDTYLNESIKSTAHLMIPIGVAKGAVDVIEGSDAVVEFGDIVQPVLDYLDVAWRVLLLSLIVSTATKYILLGALPLANSFLILSICCYLLHFVARRLLARAAALHLSVRRIAGFCLLAYLLFALILPLTVFSTATLARHITEPLRAETFASFDNVGRVFSLESITEKDGFLDKMGAIKDKASELIRFCGRASADIAGSVAKLAVVKVLEGVVFPLASLAFLIWLVRGTLYPALGLSDRSLAHADFRGLADLLRHGKHATKDQEVEPAPGPVR